MKIKWCILVLFFVKINSFSQITLKQHNFVSVGDSIVEFYKKFPKELINVGESGENKIWDFSSFDTENTETKTLKFLNPDDTPFSEEYPKANITLYSNDVYESWMFMKNSEEELKPLGSGIIVRGEKITDNYGGIVMRFPVKYLDTYSDEVVKEKVLIKNKKGQDSIKVKTVLKHLYVVDSWGDVLLPEGTFLSLRMKYTLTATNYLYQRKEDIWSLLTQPTKDTTISYKWWTDNRNAKYPVVQIVMNETNDKPIVVQYLKATPFKEIINENKDGKFKIYPNPARRKITLDLRTNNESYITIYSLEGKVVENVKTNSSKIKINVISLPVGIYFVIVRNKNGQITGKSKFIKE